jgi:cob(I)alamin adenosyltransferase
VALRKGLVHLYTGNGKGKTSAALGLCLRAVGRGLKCCFIQFVKGAPTGELFAAKELPNFEFFQTGRPGYDFKPTPADKTYAERGLKLAAEKAREADLLVLDEVVVAVHLKLLPEEAVVEFVKRKPEKLELVLTGRYATGRLIEVADYVTYFQLIKHPFYKGERAREGVDF